MCQISLRYDFDIDGCIEYTTELAKDLDEKFADRSTEFKIHIWEEEGKCFQIIKMPFKNSVITKLDCTDNSLPVLLSSWNYGDKYVKY